MLMGSIDQRGAGVRSGRASDAGCIVKRPRRRARASLVDPQGRVFKGLGRRLAPLAMRRPSPRDAILAQALDNAVLPISITRTGSWATRQGCATWMTAAPNA